jgi:hypothetical protein
MVVCLYGELTYGPEASRFFSGFASCRPYQDFGHLDHNKIAADDLRSLDYLSEIWKDVVLLVLTTSAKATS